MSEDVCNTLRSLRHVQAGGRARSGERRFQSAPLPMSAGPQSLRPSPRHFPAHPCHSNVLITFLLIFIRFPRIFSFVLIMLCLFCCVCSACIRAVPDLLSLPLCFMTGKDVTCSGLRYLILGEQTQHDALALCTWLPCMPENHIGHFNFSTCTSVSHMWGQEKGAGGGGGGFGRGLLA